MVSQAESAAQPGAITASRAGLGARRGNPVRHGSMAPLALAVRRGAGMMVELPMQAAKGGGDATDWPEQNVDYKEETDDGEEHKSPRYKPPVELNFD